MCLTLVALRYVAPSDWSPTDKEVLDDEKELTSAPITNIFPGLPCENFSKLFLDPMGMWKVGKRRHTYMCHMYC